MAMSQSAVAPTSSQSTDTAAAAADGSGNVNVNGNGGARALSPALLLGGLTAAIAVFCLLLLASRSVARAEED